MGFFSDLFRSNKNSCTNKEDKYCRYPQDLKEFCEYRDKYNSTFLLAGEYTEYITTYYSNYINYNQRSDFDSLLFYCQKYIDLLPTLEEANKEGNRINGTPLAINPYCIAYHKLAMAYEKSGCYNSALKVCEEAQSRGYSDGTKGGFESRIKRIKKKQLEISSQLIK